MAASIKKRLMCVDSKMVERAGKDPMYFIACVGMALPKIEIPVTEEQFQQVGEGMEFDGHFELKEVIADAGYGKFKWGFKPQLVKITIPKE